MAGYSWGGLLALLYALEHRDRVERLALISPAPAWRAAREQFEQTFNHRNLDPAFQEARRAFAKADSASATPTRFSSASSSSRWRPTSTTPSGRMTSHRSG